MATTSPRTTGSSDASATPPEIVYSEASSKVNRIALTSSSRTTGPAASGASASSKNSVTNPGAFAHTRYAPKRTPISKIPFSSVKARKFCLSGASTPCTITSARDTGTLPTADTTRPAMAPLSPRSTTIFASPFSRLPSMDATAVMVPSPGPSPAPKTPSGPILPIPSGSTRQETSFTRDRSPDGRARNTLKGVFSPTAMTAFGGSILNSVSDACCAGTESADTSIRSASMRPIKQDLLIALPPS